MKNILFNVCRFVYLSTMFGLVFMIPTYAYLDPATTSYIIQIIAGVAIASATFIGIFWKKICAFFRKLGLNMLGKKLEKQASKNKNK